METKNLIDASAVLVAADTAQELLPADDGREYLFIQNPGPNDVWVDFGATAVKASPSILLQEGDVWEPWIVPVNAISWIGPVTGQKLTVKVA